MKISESLAELVGAVIRDGNLWRDSRHYRIDLNGHPELDKEYYKHFQKIVKNYLTGNPMFVKEKLPAQYNLGFVQKRFSCCLQKNWGCLTEEAKAKKSLYLKNFIFLGIF
ncbi:MAG: hypothetical protein AB1476_02180 [Candidatus Hadarchaeota archaeon]